MMATATDAGAKKPPQGRASKPKSRTGCLTCKARRLKCDETKPTCKRCDRSLLTCGGYTRPFMHFRPSRQLLPSTQVLVDLTRSPRSDTIESTESSSPEQQLVLPPRMPSSHNMEDWREGQCFHTYLTETAPMINGRFGTSLWQRLIPQMCEAEPCVRHAVIALGALGRASHDSMKLRQGSQMVEQYSFGLQHYTKALSGIREMLANADQDSTRAIVASVLVFCFETFQGVLPHAVRSAQFALVLLKDWLERDGAMHRGLEGPRIRPSASLVDDDLVQGLRDVDLQILMCMDRRPSSDHERIVKNLSQALQSMPTVFHDMSLAKTFWRLLLSRNYHFMLIVLRASKSEEYCEPSLIEPSRPGFYLPAWVNMSTTPKEDMSLFRAETSRYEAETERWVRGAAALERDIQFSGSEKEKIEMAFIQLNVVHMGVMFQSLFLTDQVLWDELLPEFKVILSFCEYLHPIVTVGNGRASFQFGYGIIPALSILGYRCRDSVLRNRALELLLTPQWREGVWDSLAMAASVKWLRDIEEEERDENGDIPEDRRAFITYINPVLHDRQTFVSCTQRTKNGLVHRTEILNW